MIVVDIVGIALVMVLGVATTAALYLGLLGALGAVRMVRCDRCRKWGWTSTSQPLRSCPRCRHGNLLHTVVTLHHLYESRHRHSREVSRR